MEAAFSIAEISEKSGFSYDTIRYYVKIGLLPQATRKESGQRIYEKVHLERLIFIAHLKRTGMPLKEIERYMSLATLQKYEHCYSILSEHRRNMVQQMAEMEATMQVVDYKLEHFKELMNTSGFGGEKNEF